LVGKLADVKVD
jgi:hypothetical protein